MRMVGLILCAILFPLLLLPNLNAQFLMAQQQWQGSVLPTRLTVGYSVRVADINRDQKPDLVIVDAKRVLWLENPIWSEHVIWATPEAKFDNVCCAAEDIDGDGDLDLAVVATGKRTIRPAAERLAGWKPQTIRGGLGRITR